MIFFEFYELMRFTTSRTYHQKANLTGKINDNSAMDELLGLGLNPEGEYSNLAFNFKHSPSPVASETFDYPPRLLQGETVFRPKTFIFAEVEIELTPSEFDPRHEVPVERMLGGFYSVGDNSMLFAARLRQRKRVLPGLSGDINIGEHAWVHTCE